MCDAGVGVLSRRQLTDLTLTLNREFIDHGTQLRNVNAQLKTIGYRLDGLEAGQVQIDDSLQMLIEDNKERDRRIGELSHKVRTGFERVDTRLDEMQRNMEARFAKVDDRFTALHSEMDDRFAKVDHRFAKVEDRFTAVDKKLEAVDKRFDSVEDQLKVIAEAVGARPPAASSS